MAQHDYNLANQSGADFRADLNDALAAIVTVNSGATSPSTTFAHQLWVDTANSVLKIRNSANDAWITTGVSITADNTFDINGGTVNGITSFSFSTGSTVTSILDEDDLAYDSATALATQQSIKAYVDSQVGSVDTLAEILLNGNTTGGTDIEFGDNDKAIFGTGSDLQIFHDGSHSYISENGTGNLILKGGGQILLKSPADENMIVATGNGAVGLYYDNVAKLSTTSSGINVTGNITSTASTGSGTFNLVDTQNVLNAGNKIAFFAANRSNANEEMAFIQPRLQSNSGGAGNVQEGYLDLGTTGNKRITIQPNGDISFYDDTGTSQNMVWDASEDRLNFKDDSKSTFGTGNDLQIYHDGSHSYIQESGTGNLYITANGTDADIVIQNDDGSGGLATYMYFDGGNTNIKFQKAVYLLDNVALNLGNGGDLKIYHDGSNSYIADTGTGALNIKASNNLRLQSAGSENYLTATNNGALAIFYDNSAKLATTSDGIDVTGTVTSDGLTLGANDKIQFGTSDITGIYRTNSGSDFTMQHWGNLSMLIDSDNNDSGTRQFMIGRNSQDASTATKIALFSESGDISFYDDTGTTQGLFWDASAESLGIGTTSPDKKLDVLGDIRSIDSSSNQHQLRPTQIISYATDAILNAQSTGDDVRLNTQGTTRLIATAEGNVGIGTDSPAEAIHIQTANDTKLRITKTGTDSIYAGVDTSPFIQASSLRFMSDSSTEVGRFESSGNLLVSTTTNPVSSSGVTGLYYEADNYLAVATAGITSYFNRQGSDGDITHFRKNGTSVGSIGVSSGTIYIDGGTGSTGLYFGSSNIYPRDGGAAVDDAVDIGHASYKFRNLHLSGGVYLGGTAAANKLDDYEEGTWTPVYKSSTDAADNVTNARVGYYTKVGNMVYATVTLLGNDLSGITSTDHVRIGGLPFTASSTSSNNDQAVNVGQYRYLLTTDHTLLIPNDTAEIAVTTNGFVAATYGTFFQYAGSTSTSLKISMVYQTQ